MPNGKKEGASAKLLRWSSLNSVGNTILLVTSEATQFLAGIVNLENSSGLMNPFESVIKGDYTFMRFCRGWAHGQEVWETKANKYIKKANKANKYIYIYMKLTVLWMGGLNNVLLSFGMDLVNLC